MSGCKLDPELVTLVVDGNAYYMDGEVLMSGPVVAASEDDEIGSILEHGADEYASVEFEDFAGTSHEKAQCQRIRAALLVMGGNTLDELAEKLEQLASAMETVLLHQGHDMTVSDTRGRQALVDEAQALVKRVRS